MSDIRHLENVPEISFIEGLTLRQTEQMAREEYARLYREATGEDLVLGEADPRNLLLKAFSLIEYQVMQYIDTKGRAELLKTSTGAALDNLAALLGITRAPARRAQVTVRFTLSAKRPDVVAIPAGTRVKTQSGRYFNTLVYAQVPPGETFVDVLAQAEEAGTDSSGILAGDINILVDPIPYVAGAVNTEASTGGLDVEDDDSLTERVFLAPSRFSCAGPRDAYEYYVREWRSDVEDVQVVSPEPGVVALYAVLDGGRLLSPTERESLAAYINGEELRPLCDKVICLAPEEIPYVIRLQYWIAESGRKAAGEIQKKVEQAVKDYMAWQRALGRDINPTELIMRIRQAGAKRVCLEQPVDRRVMRTQLPLCEEMSVSYGGLEDD